MTGTRGRRLTIIGGGVMGLMTAYYAAPLASSVTVLDKSRVGDPATASFALTRLVRNDYLDPQYSRLAFEARQLWLDLQQRAGMRLLVDCGCLNLVKASVTPDVPASYAVRSFAVLEELQLRRAALPGPALAERFPQFAADGGWLDVDAGFADVAAVTALLRSVVPARGAEIREEAQIRAITRSGGGWQVQTSAGPVESDVLVITAGLGTNELLELIPGCSVRFPLSPDRPVQSKYFIPEPAARDLYTEAALPVFAYLDVGIYGHPLYTGKTPGVKVGFYHPPDAAVVPSPISSVEDFVAECMPGLRGAATVDVAEASGVDTCFYDLVGDDDFILGPVPGRRRRRQRLRRRRLARHRVQVRAVGGPRAGSARRLPRHRVRHQPLRAGPVRAQCSDSRGSGRRDSRMTAGQGIEQRLAQGVVLGAEGYVFELERRGYIKAGPYVPEVVLDFPGAVRELHREFLRAGADVMVALTYYAHREKLRHVGRENDLEAMNRHAVRLAREAAQQGGALVAGNVCNTWAYDPADPATSATVRAQYTEQLGWAVDEGVDFVISETNDYLGEALIALEVAQELGLPAMVTLASTQPDTTRDGYDYVEACRILADHGATIVGLNCDRGPVTMLPLLERIRDAVDCAVAAQPVPYRTSPAMPTMESLRADGVDRVFPLALEPFSCTRFDMAAFAAAARDLGVNYIGVCCGGAPHQVRAMAEALGREVPASKYAPAMELHPILGGAGAAAEANVLAAWNVAG